MASLGEIASGIAHEIQNPLNFVNNFAEINGELVQELKGLLAIENASVNSRGEMNMLLEDVIKNLQKIHQHGKRADSIVKSMLQHARSSSGQAEPSDMNALVEEYLRLAYHGQRLRDRAFEATLQYNFDARLPRVPVIPQDISRVLLNLFNNAFYSVTEKKQALGENYHPTISISTFQSGEKAAIRIKDNGVGISVRNREKIFQPFFTTKPTGEGTGLGLSLSYEIIKAHRGELKVDSAEGEFAEFTIELPLGTNVEQTV
jgi:two-component system, NtrC family, sensor kinase